MLKGQLDEVAVQPPQGFQEHSSSLMPIKKKRNHEKVIEHG
jgi:hypothetical protein